MKSDLPRLAMRIRSSLVELDILMRRIEKGWQRYLSSGDDFYLDGVALNVYTFKFDPDRIDRLVDEAPEMLRRVNSELLAFADFLEQNASR